LLIKKPLFIQGFLSKVFIGTLFIPLFILMTKILMSYNDGLLSENINYTIFFFVGISFMLYFVFLTKSNLYFIEGDYSYKSDPYLIEGDGVDVYNSMCRLFEKYKIPYNKKKFKTKLPNVNIKIKIKRNAFTLTILQKKSNKHPDLILKLQNDLQKVYKNINFKRSSINSSFCIFAGMISLYLVIFRPFHTYYFC